MPASAGTMGTTTVLKMGNGGSPETFTTIAEITSVTPPALSKDSVEVTNMDSPQRFREFIPGLKDGGEVTVEVNWLPGDPTHDASSGYVAQFMDDDNHNFQIDIASQPRVTWAFRGHISSISPEAPLDDKLSNTIVIKVSGPPTLV